TKAGKEMVEEAAQQVLEKRRALVAEIADLEGKEAEELRRTAGARGKAEKKYRELHAKAEEAKREFGLAMQAQSGVVAHFDGAISRCEGALRQSADPRLEEFLREIRNLEDTLRNGSYVIPTGSRTNIYTGHTQQFYSSNINATVAALQACKSVREQAEE